MTMTVNQGSRGRTSWAQLSAPSIGREDTQFAEEIALLERWVNPLTLLSMKIKRSRSRTIDVHYFEDEYVPYVDQVNYGTGYNSSATSIVVDHGEYFAAGDLIRHCTTDEVMLVTAVSSDTLTVVRDFGQSTESWTALADSITDNDYFEVLGNAFEPGHVFPTVKTTQEVERINYCQDVRTPLSISEVAEQTRLRAGQDWPYQTKKASTEHMQKIERQNIWGKPYRSDKGNYVAATGNTAPAQAGGINHFISENTDTARKVDQTDLTEFEFMDFVEVGMEYGSRTKYLYCPPALRTGFDKWGITRLNSFSTDTVQGMKVNTWQSSHGDIIIITHDMLKRNASTLYHYAFLLDMDMLEWVTFGNSGSTRLRPAGDHSTTGSTLTQAEYQTISCLLIKQANQHARLRFKTISV